MFWSTGLILALVLSQVPAEFATPEFIENVIGESPSKNQRILSGWQAYPGQIPHQTSLRMVNVAGGVSGCGGSIVSRDWVITAAHCTAGQITIVVRAGVTSLLTPQYIFETQEWYNHFTYDDNFPGIVQPNDIGILKLQRPVTYSRLLQPIRIQPSSLAFHNYDNEVVIASGFGRTWTDGATSEDLNWVYLRAVSNLACGQTFGTALINSNAICARFYNVTSQSVCQGDSGGPLVHVGNDGVPTLVGIASFVAGGNFGCHSGLPSGFIRPGPFLAWLNEVTGIDFENLNEEDEVTTPQPEVPSTPQPEVPSTPQPEVPSTPQPEVPSTPQPEVPTSPQPEAPQTTVYIPTTEIEYIPTTSPPRPTTVRPPTSTTPLPEEESEEEDNNSQSSSEEDPETCDLLKKLIVKVKVKVNVNNELKKKVKVKHVEKKRQ